MLWKREGPNVIKEVIVVSNTKEINGPSSWSVVTWVIRAKFFTSPQASPSGVSHGQSIPHYSNKYHK